MCVNHRGARTEIPKHLYIVFRVPLYFLLKRRFQQRDLLTLNWIDYTMREYCRPHWRESLIVAAICKYVPEIQSIRVFYIIILYVSDRSTLNWERVRLLSANRDGQHTLSICFDTTASYVQLKNTIIILNELCGRWIPFCIYFSRNVKFACLGFELGFIW